jgi:hypothetical protein
MVSMTPGKRRVLHDMIAFEDARQCPRRRPVNLPRDIPAELFWSVILYEAENALRIRPFKRRPHGFRLAMETPDEIAAVAAVAASLPRDDDSSCPLQGRTSGGMLINGTADFCKYPRNIRITSSVLTDCRQHAPQQPVL